MNVKLVKVPEELLIELHNLKQKKESNKISFSLSNNTSNKNVNEGYFVNKVKKHINLPNIFYDECIDDVELDYASEINKTKLEPTFYDLIIKYTDRLKIEDSQLYKNAYVDRRLFSKIRSGHKPNRNTVMRIGLALHLNIEEFTSLLNSCHYSLYNDEYFDVAIKYFINNEIYDIDKCNDILYSCKLDLLIDYDK